MKKATLVAFSFLLVLAFAVSSSFGGEEKGEKVTVEGNVICLIPDYQKGTVNPVIADGPCHQLPPHEHVLVSKEGKLYHIQGLEKGLLELEKNPQRRDVKVTGMVEPTPRGWILYVQ